MAARGKTGLNCQPSLSDQGGQLNIKVNCNLPGSSSSVENVDVLLFPVVEIQNQVRLRMRGMLSFSF